MYKSLSPKRQASLPLDTFESLERNVLVSMVRDSGFTSCFTSGILKLVVRTFYGNFLPASFFKNLNNISIYHT